MLSLINVHRWAPKGIQIKATIYLSNSNTLSIYHNQGNKISINVHRWAPKGIQIKATIYISNSNTLSIYYNQGYIDMYIGSQISFRENTNTNHYLSFIIREIQTRLSVQR